MVLSLHRGQEGTLRISKRRSGKQGVLPDKAKRCHESALDIRDQLRIFGSAARSLKMRECLPMLFAEIGIRACRAVCEAVTSLSFRDCQ